MSIDASIPINNKLEITALHREVAQVLKELLGLRYEPEVSAQFRLGGVAQNEVPRYLESDSLGVLWLGLVPLEEVTYVQVYSCLLLDTVEKFVGVSSSERPFAVVGMSGGGFRYIMLAACIIAICQREKSQVTDSSFLPEVLFNYDTNSVLEKLRCKIPTENIEVAMSEVLKNMRISQNKSAGKF